MKKIAVFTGTRAEYGILCPLLRAIKVHPLLELKLIVSAMHLSPEFGLSIKEIQNDGFVIDEQVEMLLSSNTPVGCAKSVGLGVIGFTDCLSRLAPDVLVVLGDRFEALAIAQTAMFLSIPIAHLHGGEITEGAKDDVIRHVISKLSSIHFTANEAYRKRVIQLGEQPGSVYNVGSLGVENIIKHDALLSKSALEKELGATLGEQYVILTYHSVTLADEDPIATFDAIYLALCQFPQYKILITYPNADEGGRAIIARIKVIAAQFPDHVVLVPTLGYVKYFSAVKHACAVIGNSSSGIIEVPTFGVPTVNVGQRQKGRMAAASVIHCEATREEITSAIHLVVDKKVPLDGENPYAQVDSTKEGAEYPSDKMVDILVNHSFSVQKSFYDLVEADDNNGI